MSNIYDIYRGVQTKRNECYDERSAAFIEQGKLSKEVFHVRLKKDIKAALVFKHQEGPDEVLVYSYLSDDLQKSDYFVYKNTNYLVYEENRLTDDDISYKKQKAVECNVAFTFEGTVFNGYYKSSLRGSEDQAFEGRQLISPDETPLLILPTNSTIKVNSEFAIEDKPFKVMEFDSITNKGISYYYLERNYNKNIPEVGGLSIMSITTEPEIINELETVETLQENMGLRAMVEYTFKTEDAFFSTTPAVEILAKKRTEVKFRVPFGISEISIKVKENAIISEKTYKVVVE